MPMHKDLVTSRRGLLAWLASSAVLACTSTERPDDERVQPVPEDPLLRSSPVGLLLIADSGSPVVGSSTELSVYDDGWATLLETPGVFFGEQDYRHTDRTWTLPATTIDRLRSLLETDQFLEARPHYRQPGVLDGGATTYVGGSPLRHVIVVNTPDDIPGSLTQLEEIVRETIGTVRERGADPFEDPSLGPRATIVLQYEFSPDDLDEDSDRITVFDDGLVEYRLTRAGEFPEDGDHPTPTAITRQLAPRALQGIRGKVRHPDISGLAFVQHGTSGDRHQFFVSGKRAFRTGGATLEPALRAIVEELAPVRRALRAAYRDEQG